MCHIIFVSDIHFSINSLDNNPIKLYSQFSSKFEPSAVYESQKLLRKIN